MRKPTRGAGLLATLALTALCAAQNSDNGVGSAANETGPGSTVVTTEGLGTLIAGPYNVGALGANECFGVEEAWGHFWVTGAGNPTTGWIRMIHKYDHYGRYIASYPQTTNSTGWGGRDMEADEANNLLWVGSDHGEVSEYTYSAGALTHAAFRPIATSESVTALCRDDDTGHFYAKDFGDVFYEFDMRTGAVVNQITAPDPRAVGFGWDWVNGTIWSTHYGGPFGPVSVTEITTSCVATGRSFGPTWGMWPGGADVYEDPRNPGYLSIVCLGDEFPDGIMIWDLGVPIDGCSRPVVYCTHVDPSTSTACGFQQCPSSSGCRARIAVSDMSACPVSGANDYDVLVSKAEDNKPGLLFYGLQGRASISPFSSGTLCVKPPLQRTAVQSTGGGSGGTPGCYDDQVAWLLGAGPPTWVEDFSGFVIDTSFEPGPVDIQGGSIGVCSGGIGHWNKIDAPPFQFSYNGTTYALSFVNWDEPTEICVVPDQPLGAFGCSISYGLGLTSERVEMACMSGGSEMYVCAPATNTIDAFCGVISGALLDQVIYRSQTFVAGHGGQRFGLDDLLFKVGPSTGSCGGTLALTINDPAGVDLPPGTVANFQGWTRDPTSPSGTDLSDAVEITYR